MKIVIMAGGKGTRFWPRSIEEKPKQFLSLTSEYTMIQQTYWQFREWLPKEDIFILTTRLYSPLILEQLPELKQEQLIIEPDQRDTGPCIALSALHFLSKGMDDVLVTTPSDHYIPDGKALKRALIEAAETAATSSSILTLGVVPTRPETGYGYIETSSEALCGNVYPVKRFIEKPSHDRAQQLFNQKNYYWNTGIFIWKPSTIADNMKQFQPYMWNKLSDNMDDLENVYPKLERISVDYAILEKAEHIYNIPVDFAWDDIGSWTSMERVHPADRNGNIILGNVSSISSHNNIIYSEQQKAVVIGLEEIIVVSTKDGLLVCRKADEQKIKDALRTFSKDEGGN
ncbi:mannose-1-phosphate guanylyltransferase [Paenibacillus vini]|uniref:Mannose-1-phosphate guanylyltransferase n=1 Tax=Paenibacillus vini TaxID=1476024 RepID=A0ABQ4MGG7_9BACL|nr:mannose-1-phosphate guanylyltransferase [Paenibacillus vini]GIP55059.1 mannose-1-phosphate guanylyltransferase [Paenibacillus vini]